MGAERLDESVSRKPPSSLCDEQNEPHGRMFIVVPQFAAGSKDEVANTVPFAGERVGVGGQRL